jgi:nitrogen regulatory protein PII
MHHHPMILITVVCDERMLPPLLEILQHGGATGYTTTDASGLSFNRATAEAPRRLVQVIVPHEEADEILAAILDHNFQNESFVLWTTEIKVFRRGRFLQ